MQLSAKRLLEGLREVFPDCADMAVSIETQLCELPDWDSMAAVNLQTFLLQQFGVEVPLDLMADQTSLQEVLAFLENPIPSEAAY
jgi:acyl carrier protein